MPNQRPKFFGKTFTAIITQGIPVGDKDIRKDDNEVFQNKLHT
jgi:hypothetical protein